MLFAQYMCCSPSMEVQIEETETGSNVYLMFRKSFKRHVQWCE